MIDPLILSIIALAAFFGVLAGLLARPRVRTEVAQAREAGRAEGRQEMWAEVTAVPRWRVVATCAATGKTVRVSPLVPYVGAVVLANSIKADGVRVELVCESKAEGGEA